MNYAITHRTTYDYAEPVSVSYHAARFEPRSNGTQTCSDFSLAISPAPAVKKSRTDFYGNSVTFFEIQESHLRMEITARSRVTVAHGSAPDMLRSAPFAQTCARFRDPVSPEDVKPYEFCLASPMIGTSPDFAAYARECFAGDCPALVGVRALTSRIFRDFKYDPKATTVATPVDDVWRNRRGVCQDFAHVMIGLCRAVNIPALYVSGYLYNGPRDTLLGAQASHAWCEVFLPDVGWHGLDPTNNQATDERYIKLAIGTDYAEVPPVRGHYRGATERRMSIEVLVDRLDA